MSAAKIERLRQYLLTQPDKPDGRQYRRAILVSDSKGYSLRNNYPKPNTPFELWCEGGATCEKLVDIIEERCAKAVRRHHRIVIYFWGGTCDITERDEDTGRLSLRESDNNTAISDILIQLHRALNIVERNKGAQIKFVGIPTISIIAWNRKKGQQYTDHLKDQEHQVIEQVELLNKELVALNNTIGINSLQLNKALRRTRKKPNKPAKQSLKITLLRDGVHPGLFLSLHWARILIKDTFYYCYLNPPNTPNPKEEDILQLDVNSSELEEL